MPIKSPETLVVDPRSPDQEMVRRAATWINRGGLVVFPTSTFYGIGAQALNVHAVDRVFQVKERHKGNPLLVLIASLDDLSPLVQSIPETAEALIKAFWPGGITLVFDAADTVPENLTGYTGKIGVRLASHPVAGALVKVVSGPITGTSANLSGEGGCTAVADLSRRINDQVDLVLDAGQLAGVRGSTVVDVTTKSPRILREGVIRADTIRALFDDAQ
ncbi:MAG: L-threonylcarbamoyladenylate synthase [Thermodesulfobacteriota bacterium]|nr:L-threonylcarbamoyladenylate synthase [Thermodesulfobacteriota bacterium]